LAGLNELVVFHIHPDNGSGDPRADHVQVPVHFGIIGRLIRRQISPQESGAHQHQNQRDGAQQYPAGVSLYIPARTLRERLFGFFGLLRLLLFCLLLDFEVVDFLA
jgi:hypothetical protein